MADLNQLAEQIVGLTLLQAQELKQILKDQYGIEPAAEIVCRVVTEAEDVLRTRAAALLR